MSRTNWWEDQTHTGADAAVIALNLAGLLACIAFAAGTYLGAVALARLLSGTQTDLRTAFLGSLVPIGGHNILEASLLKKPVLFGPHMQNFKSISKLLLEAGGGIQADSVNLADKLELLLEDPVIRREMGEKGAALFAEHSGATIRTVETAKQIMGVG